MAVQAVNINSFSKPISEELKGPWAILGLLSMVRDTINKGQQKIAESTQKLIENGSKIQDKRSKELNQVTKLGLEALKEEAKAKLVKDIGLGIIVATIVGGPIIAAISAGSTSIFAAASQFITPLLVVTSGGLEISALEMSLKTADKQLKIAEIDKHNNIDAGLAKSNNDAVSLAGKTVRDSGDAGVKLQKAITEVINSTGSALQKSIR